MKAFGLTGNIGCGKSTVAKLLSEYPDVLVIDCDFVAKEIILGDLYKQEINSILDADVFADGRVDLKAIAKIIFTNPEKKKLFEELIHPLVWASVQEKVDAAPSQQICVVESAIIYETGSEDMFASVIVAVCDQEEQFRRLQANRNMSRAQIEVRVAQQLASSKKEEMAKYVVRTDCNWEELKANVADLYQKLRQQKGVQT
jgi:dephospho-CoA kinase